MRIETALKLRDRLRTRIADIYSVARLVGLSSDEMVAQINKLRADSAKAPAWVWSYLDGYQHALRDDLYHNHLVYGGYVNGVFYSTHRNRADYYEKHGIEPSAYADDGAVTERGHYYPPNGHRTTYKPYFTCGIE